MDRPDNRIIFSYRDGALEPRHGALVREYPLQLIVNDREIATLIASPHQLHFLVAGFLRLQGFVSSADDFLMLSVCEEFGTANVRIRGTLPEKLKPVLTSGCGTGISFNIPSAPAAPAAPPAPVSPASLFALMGSLARRAEQYRSHGGIHSAAAGRSGELLLHAEDLGRHNTIDRIAGEALLRGIDLTGAELVTSGRVSTEMVAKAALLGVRLIASRTSPTDMAAQLCDQAGICLVGYLRGESFSVYSHPEGIARHPEGGGVEGVTGVILAGGKSTRMGRNKALLEVGGRRLIELVHDRMARLFGQVILVTNTPQEYRFLPCRSVADIHAGIGSLAGIHAALTASPTDRIFVAACDMPSLSEELIRHLCESADGCDAVVPRGPAGLEPLHALYSRSCLPVFEQALLEKRPCIYDLYPLLSTRIVPWDDIRDIPGASGSFANLNTPSEYEAAVPQTSRHDEAENRQG